MHRFAGVALAVLVNLNLAAARAEPPEHAAVVKFFTSADPFVRQTVLPNIEKHRKSAVTLRFVDSHGRALPDLTVRGGLRQHQFLFGACPPESKADLDPKFVKAWSALFNYGVVQNAGKWGGVEKQPGRYDFSRIDQLLELGRQNSVALEYHFLSGYHPTWLGELPDAEKARRQQAYAREVLRRYKDKFAFFQVYNEDWCTHIARAKVYYDQTEFFAQLAAEFPGVKLGVSDCWTLHPTAPLPDPRELKQRYPGISYLALHAHKPRRLWASPQAMYHEFDKYLGSGIKLHLTEFGIDYGTIEGDYRQGEWTEENKAEYFVQVRAVAFSHPAVEAVNHWDMGPGKRSRTGNSLLNDDLSPKPAYEALHALLKQRLSTAFDGRTNAQGEYRFHGFHGRYEATMATSADRTATLVFDVGPAKSQYDVTVDDRDGSAVRLRIR